MPRFTTVALLAGAALLVRRAVRSRMTTAPLWPLPALDEPVSGYGRGSTVPRKVLVTGRATPAEGVVELRLEGTGLPPGSPAPMSTSSCPPASCGSTRSAVTRPTPPRTPSRPG